MHYIKKHFTKLIILSSTLIFGIILVGLGVSAQSNNCAPNSQSFQNGTNLEDCPAGLTSPSFNTYKNFRHDDGTTFDERDFLMARNVTLNERYSNNVTVNTGQTVRISAYLHNNCRPDLNDEGRGACVARNVKTFIRNFTESNSTFVTESLVRHNITQTFSASNTTPRSVTDNVAITSNNSQPVVLEYIANSAIYVNAKEDANGNGRENRLAARQLFGNGADITSVFRNARYQENGQVFGSDDYAIYTYFDVVVKPGSRPDEPGGGPDCTDLELFNIVNNSDRSISFSHRTAPTFFNNQVTVQVTQGTGQLRAEAGDRFRLSGYNENTVVLAQVPGSPQCRALFNVRNHVDFDACLGLTLTPGSFNPLVPRNKFTVTPNPSSYSSFNWQVTGNTNNVTAMFTPDRTMATFTNLSTDNKVRVYGTGNIAPGATCEATAESELPPAGEYCLNANLAPKHFPANGDRREFTFEYFPADYKGEFIWRTVPAGVGTFADGDKIGNPIRTNSRRVVFRGGTPGSQVVVEAADAAFSARCSDRAFAGNFPGDDSDSLVKTANTAVANPGDTVTYTINYKYDPFFAEKPNITILDTIGVKGSIPGNRGGRITAIPGSERINIPKCQNASSSNCYLGSIFNKDGITLQNFRSTTIVKITYQGKVDTVIDPKLCEGLTSGFCGEQFINEAVDSQNHVSRHTITVLCPAFRSYGFGDLLLEESFKGGIDTRQCGGRPNTEGIILTPEQQQSTNNIVSTGGEDVILPTHGACREANVKGFENISSELCEIQSKLSDKLTNQPLTTVQRNAELVCKNAVVRSEVTLRNGSTAELKQYANPNNLNELVICANKITTSGPITIDYDGSVTLVANSSITINGDITYSSNTKITPSLVAISKGSLTTVATRFLSGIFITLPDSKGNFAPMVINPDPARPGKAFEVIGSLIGTNFEVRESDFNIIYDLGRFLITEPSVLNDALDFVQELTINQ